MRSYLLDEVSVSDIGKIVGFLNENALRSGMEKLFWVEIPKDCFNETQVQHIECQPYFFAIELGTDWIKTEFFVRTLKNLQCQCSGYCNLRQGNFIFNFMEIMLKELDIKT
ncbi:hypothetical protein ACFL0H_03935 [Thermodesulfobacteriota bacterium]